MNSLPSPSGSAFDRITALDLRSGLSVPHLDQRRRRCSSVPNVMPPKEQDKKEPAGAATGGADAGGAGGAGAAAGGAPSGGAATGPPHCGNTSGGAKSGAQGTGATNKLPTGQGPPAGTPPPGRNPLSVGRDDGLIQLSPAALQQLLAAAVATATGAAPPADVNHRKLPKFWDEEPEAWFSVFRGSFDGRLPDELVMFNKMLPLLPPTAVSLCRPLVGSQARDVFQQAERLLLAHYRLRPLEHGKRLHSCTSLGDRTPTSMLQSMRSLQPALGSAKVCFSVTSSLTFSRMSSGMWFLPWTIWTRWRRRRRTSTKPTLRLWSALDIFSTLELPKQFFHGSRA